MAETIFLATGIIIGWLLRWKRDKYYFDEMKKELEQLKKELRMFMRLY